MVTALTLQTLARISHLPSECDISQSSAAPRNDGAGVDFPGFGSLQGVDPASPPNLHETPTSTRPPFARDEFCEISGLAGVQSVDICDPEQVRLHMSGLLKSYPVKSIKTGMLGSGCIVKVVTEVISQFRHVPLVVDPVLRSTSGRSLLDEDGIRELKKELLPRCDLVTPNLTELAELTGRDGILSSSDESDAALKLLETGCGAVLAKGGHRKGDSVSDRLFSPDGVKEFPGERVDTPNTRGTGCSLASGIAAGLAAGSDLQTAIQRAKSMVQNSLEHHKDDVWPGSGPAL